MMRMMMMMTVIVIIGSVAPSFKLLARDDQPLLVWRKAFFLSWHDVDEDYNNDCNGDGDDGDSDHC